MNRKAINRVRCALLRWGKANYQPYPWRDIDSPWLAMLAEILLQRTNATQVARQFWDVAERLPTPEAALAASDEELGFFDDRFGLNRRAQTIRQVAGYFLEHRSATYDELLTLYGIGHYTAAAFLSLHMNQRAVLVDANVARWLSRLTGLDRPADLRRAGALSQLAQQLTPAAEYKAYNYAVLDFTMQLCRPRAPNCGDCPLRQDCAYLQSQQQAAI